MAGYSENPLVKKLGVKPGASIYLYNTPPTYLDWLFPLPEEVTFHDHHKNETDFFHLFVVNQKEFEKEFVKAKKHLNKKGMIWVSWPKKSSKVPTDLNENVIRDFGLAQGLVDVKVCAVSDVWSGLKFVFRLKDR